VNTIIGIALAASITIAVSGCAPTGPAQGTGTVLGAVAGGVVGNQFGHGPGRVAATLAGAAIGGVLGGSIGAQIDEADRQAAYNAQIDAVSYGQRRTWRGPDGAYGYIDPGPEIYRAEGYCREYTHTIYIGGRPQAGTGLACRQPDGTWRIVS
jgi:surface antigen